MDQRTSGMEVGKEVAVAYLEGAGLVEHDDLDPLHNHVVDQGLLAVEAGEAKEMTAETERCGVEPGVEDTRQLVPKRDLQDQSWIDERDEVEEGKDKEKNNDKVGYKDLLEEAHGSGNHILGMVQRSQGAARKVEEVQTPED